MYNVCIIYVMHDILSVVDDHLPDLDMNETVMEFIADTFDSNQRGKIDFHKIMVTLKLSEAERIQFGVRCKSDFKTPFVN